MGMLISIRSGPATDWRAKCFGNSTWLATDRVEYLMISG
jgi:hypothetical protein